MNDTHAQNTTRRYAVRANLMTVGGNVGEFGLGTGLPMTLEEAEAMIDRFERATGIAAWKVEVEPEHNHDGANYTQGCDGCAFVMAKTNNWLGQIAQARRM